MKRTEKSPSELVTAAVALSEGLRRFDELTHALQQAPLTSQKKLQRAASLFQELGEAEAELGRLVQTTVGALQDARRAQESSVAIIQACATAYQARSGVLQRLLQDYAAIGASAAELNAHVQAVADGPLTGDDATRQSRLTDILDRIQALVDRTQAFMQQCAAEDFHDVARLADGLRNSLVAARKGLAQAVRTRRDAEPEDLPTGSPTEAPEPRQPAD
ncbi:MAG TPA: hypothetical protein VFH51_17805 [Myxococcota bacterium]|nr:hypothetical protein [Myxococcota bacterium]